MNKNNDNLYNSGAIHERIDLYRYKFAERWVGVRGRVSTRVTYNSVKRSKRLGQQ